MQQIWHGFQKNLGTNPKTNLCEKLLKFTVEWEAVLYRSVHVQQESGHDF
jgi:hypothetical protein